MFFVLDGLENFGEQELRFFMPYLTGQRREKVDAYRFLPDKISSAAVFLLLRCALPEWNKDRFEFGFPPTGKPFFLSRSDVRFSLSHDRKGVCVCVSDKEVGADVQELFPYEENLAERILSPKEKAAFEGREGKDRLLTRIWTLKESYVKKTGEGLASITKTDFSRSDGNEFCQGGDRYFTGEKGDLFFSVCSSEKQEIRIWTPDEFFAAVKQLSL